MTMSACAGLELYRECCAAYGVKPNKELIEQIDGPGFLTLEQIDASRTFLGDFGVQALLDFVDNHAGIQRLFLEKNGIDAICVRSLCRVLHQSSSLSCVDLSENLLSMPSVRLLWEAVRSSSVVRKLRLENCGITEDWLSRLDRCCKSNDELWTLGFHQYGPERSPREWKIVFILVLGPPRIVQKYCADILPSVASLVSRLRLRIIPLTIEETDSQSVVRNKVQRCEERHNYSLSWCVALIDKTEQWHSAGLSALAVVLRQEEPVMPPLRNKVGTLREKKYHCAKHFFVYDVSFLHGFIPGNGEGWGTARVPPNVWLSALGVDVQFDVSTPSAVMVASESCWKVRCQSDLHVSLNTVFSEQPRSMDALSLEDTNEDKDILEEIDENKPIGSLHPKCVDIVRYVESPPGPISAPLCLFGSSMLGKSKILSWIVAKYGATESLKVVPYRVEGEKRSLVVFLYHILYIFSTTPKRIHHSVEELVDAVHDSIYKYNGKLILLLISRVDHFDSCGSSESMVLEWLPLNLPPTVKVILTLQTGSPLLSALRKRQPQPYEVLITPFPKHVRGALFLDALVQRNVCGINTDNSGVQTMEHTRKALEDAFLQKDGSDRTSFAMYTASFLWHKGNELAAQDLLLAVSEDVPETVDEVLKCLLKRYETLGDPLTLQYAMLCLAITPLPISELVYICEELGPCSRQKTLPILLMLSDDALVRVSTKGIVQLSASDVRLAVLSLYAEFQDSVSALVERHLYRLVKTQSPDMSFCFRQLSPLMIANGSFNAATSLVLNTVVMDTLFRRDSKNRRYAIDLIFRLLNLRDFLMELGDGVASLEGQKVCRLDRGALYNALESIQLYNGFFFQSSLLASDASPYHQQAVEVAEVPYTVLVPLNRGDEDSAMHSLKGKHACIHCHLCGAYLAVTTVVEVVLYSTTDFSRTVARLCMPFEQNKAIRGGLIAAGTRVVVIGDGQLLLWDFSAPSITPLEDTTASLRVNALDQYGLRLVARHPSRGSLSILDVSKKNVASELPPLETSIHEAFFCGSGVLAIGLYDLFMIREGEIRKFSHTDIIRCVCVSGDGRFIASSVKEDMWIWSYFGDLLHIIGAGLAPLEDICLNANGSMLLARHCDQMKVWDSLNGGCITTLESYFGQVISFACFAEDGPWIIGCCGSHIIIWDAYSFLPIGALTCSAGHFTFLQERNHVLIATTSTMEVKVWHLDAPLPTIQMAKERSVTTMWQKNPKVSCAPIVQLDVNSTGTLLAIVDANNALFIQPFDGDVAMERSTASVGYVAFLGDMILFTVPGEGRRFFCRDLSEGGATAEVALPGNSMMDAVLKLVTGGAESLVAVISNAKGCSVIYVYDAPKWSLTNQFIGHSGSITHAFFTGDFLLSVGEDRTVRLWSLVRHAERTSYLHDCHIVVSTMASSSLSSSSRAALFIFDERLRLFHVKVDNIMSSTQARIVANEVVITLTLPSTLKVTQAALAPQLFVLVSEDGSVYLLDLRRGGEVSRLSDYKCCCVSASSSEGSDAFVVTGHSTGEVVLHRVLFAV